MPLPTIQPDETETGETTSPLPEDPIVQAVGVSTSDVIKIYADYSIFDETTGQYINASQLVDPVTGKSKLPGV